MDSAVIPINMRVPKGESIVRMGRFTVDLRSAELQDGDKRLSIQQKPFEVLRALLESPGQLVTRQALYSRLWGGTSADYDVGLDTAVKKLRRMLQDSAKTPSYIETLPKRGYRLIAPVSAIPDIRNAYNVTNTSGAAESPPSDEATALRLYLEGRHHWMKRTPRGQLQALSLFRQAQKFDPTNSHYSIAIAQAYVMLASHGVVRPVDAIADAKTMAVAALLQDHSQIPASILLSYIRGAFDYDLKGAHADLTATFQLAPPGAWEYIALSFVAIAVGALDEAIAALNRAQDLDPVLRTATALQGFARYIAGRLREAVEFGGAAVIRDPEFGLAHFYYGQELLAAGRFDEALGQLGTAYQLMEGAWEVRATLGLAANSAGERVLAEKIAAELSDLAKSCYVDAYHRALLSDALGAREEAVALLEQSADDHAHWFALATVDPKLASLRSDERVVALLRRLRL